MQKIFICTLLLLTFQIAGAADPPNVIIIFADDLGYGDLACYGHPTIKTPHLDRMAREGMRFTQFYAAASVCTPSRAGLLTGRYPVRTGMVKGKIPGRVLFPNDQTGLPLNEVTIAEVLKERDYHTYMVGKWHLGHLPEYLPTRQGFDHYYGIPYSNDMDHVGPRDGRPAYWNVPLLADTNIVERPVDQTTLTRRYTEKALAFIEAHQKEPFFLYLAHTMPHIPLFASADFLNQSKRGLYGDVVEEIDWSVGQILDALAQLDLDQNTLVIFTSDNGPWLVQQERGGSAGLLRDGKGTTWEGGLRVPMIAWRPGVIPGRTTTTALATTLDLLPTVAEMSGAQAPENIDGRSLLPLLRGQEHRPREYFAYYRNDEVYAVRYGPWKAHYITQTEYPAGPQEHHDPPLLFNLETDPSERFNRAESHPGIIAKIDAWRAAHLKTVSTAFAPSLEAEAFLETARVTGGRLRVQQILSLLEYQASDLAGNTAACLIRVKVEKMGAPSPLADLVACPDDQVVNTNLGECGALVNGNNISPAFGNVCADGLSVVYSIQHEQDDEARSGIYHGGDLFFSPGLNTVQYRVQNQPLLLISEITHHLPAPPPGAPDLSPLLQPGADVLEIANFGPAGLEVGGLGIERIHATGQDTLTLPSGSLLPAGKVMTIHFGDGVDTPEEGFFHVPGAADLPQNAGAAYVISHAGTVLDVVVIGNIDPAGQSLLASVQPTDWSGALGGSAGSFLRRTAWDTHTAADFTAPDACRPATLGNWNPEWPQGNHIAAYLPLELSSLQQTTCSFTVTIEDHEIPALGSAGDPAVQTNDSFLTIEAGECLTASIEWTEDVETADVNVYLAGQTPAFGDLSFTLISPAGREVVLAQGVCTAANAYQFTLDSDAAVSIAGSCGNLGSNGHFRPQNELGWFDGESALGVWTLQIGHAGNLSADPATLSEWRLEISSRDAYSQPDEVLENDPGECGAEYSWTHPLFFDNCPGGEMHMQIHDGEGMLIADLAIPPANWGEPTSRFFDIGENTVQYLLTDEAGNVKNYTFSVAVEDVETPALQCPDDLTVTLPPGECHTSGLPLPVTATDNCGVTDLAYDPPQTVMGIGSTDLTLTAADAAGNVDSCTFNITVAEHLPGSVILACNDEINLNLGSDCEAEITADMLLEGNDYRCYDNYIVQVYPGDVGTDGDPIPTSPFVNLDYVDQQMVAEVCDPETGFCCWGYVNVEYKVTPQFICPADTVVSCNMNMDPEYMGAPVVTSCVPGGASVTYSDEMIDHGACASPRATLMRTWTVSNALGMDTSETQHIMIQTFDLDQIDFPSHFDDLDAPALSCGSVNADPSLIEPENTGFPTIDGELFGASDAYCSTSIIYTDEIYNLCAGSYDLHRIWKVLNTCVPVAAGVNPREYIQVIKVADMADPEITCPGDITVGASPFNCRGAVILPEPDITDACSNAPYAITVSTGTLSELNGVFNLSNLPVGEHEVVYLATDGCNRSADCSFKVTVIDGIPPISMISEAAELNLSADGYGKLEADEIDQGSWDNCGVTNVQVRRAFARDSVTCEPVTAFFSEWGPYVEFRCCDINEEVFIEMRATDGYGNSDVSSMTVLVKDHLRPYCIPPEETDIDCADLPPDFDPMDTQQLQNLFGTPEPFDNCSAVWEELDPEMSMQNCSAGLLTRRFRAIDGNGSVSVNNCSQAITINGFQNYEIRFPQDAEAVCGIPNPDTLIFNELGCDLLAVSADDETFAASGDECYQINRTYRVINWCEYDGESDPIIVPRDEDCDGAPGYAAATGDLDDDAFRGIWVLVRPDGVTYYDRDTDEDNHQPAASIKGTACDGQTNPPGHWRNSAFDPTISSVGYWQYTQKIKVFDTIPPEILPGLFDPFCSLDDGDCEGQVDIPLAIEENCTPEDLTIAAFFQAFNQPVAPTPDNDISGEVLTGTYPDYLISGAFPVGDHSFRIMVEDGCGQTNQLDIPFTVADCLAPTPICNNSLSISLMPLPPGEDVNGDGNPDVGAATIWAEDFITGVSSDCSGPVTYSINRPGDDPDPDQAGLIVTCADQGGLIVEIHTWDATGNNDFCLTSIFVQENLTGLCSGGGLGSATVAGGIETPDNDQVEGVEVMLSGQQSGSAVSDDQGTYIFPSIVVGQDYTLTPQFDGDWINGVSTIDIVKILKHILGVEALEGPYHMIAADANRSETITTLDVIKLRKLILGIDEEIPENTSWRFIDADYVFPDPNDPWLEDFPEVININNLQGPLVDADFQAIKVGDVNFNAATQSLASADERNFHGAFYLEVEDLDLQAGQTYPVMFRASDLTNIQGFQGSLAFDPEALDFVDMAYGLAQPGHFGYRFLDEGAITMSWNADFDEAFAPADMPLFTVHFRAKTDAALPELLEINSAFTPAEAYDGSEERLTLAIDFQKKRPLADEFRLFPNRPNPFREATVISFYLPEESAAVRLCIYTIEGRLLREVRGDFGAGYQEIELTAAGLSAAGLLYYTLETDVHFDSGKMIFLR